jgi:threonine synthase
VRSLKLTGFLRCSLFVRSRLQLYTLEQCVVGAYAADGGMFLPASLPQLSPATLLQWSQLSFQQLVLAFLSLFIEEEDVPRAQLQAMIERAYAGFMRRTAERDGAATASVVDEIGFRSLPPSDRSERSLLVAELWHGPTLAFKDLPLQVLGQLLGHFVDARARKASAEGKPVQRVSILVGTSGDTGSAAIEAVRSCSSRGLVDIFVLYPALGRITRVQEAQMSTVRDPHVHVGAVDGTSDELDQPILALFTRDEEFKRKQGLCSINSVNVLRILLQCVHFFYAYFRVRLDGAAAAGRTLTEDDFRLSGAGAGGQLADFTLPTGAAGHLVAGVVAKQMGCPIGRLCAANNDNDLLATLLRTGRYEPRKDGAQQTSSPAIDIQQPYNIERLLYLLAPVEPAATLHQKHLQRASYTRSTLAHLAQHGFFELSPTDLQRWTGIKSGDAGLTGARVEHAQVLRAIADCWRSEGYLLDPHTAVGVVAARKLAPVSAASSSSNPVVVFSTAHPAKFLPTVAEATGLSESALESLFLASEFDAVRHSMHLLSLPSAAIPFDKHADWEKQLRELVANTRAKHEREEDERSMRQQPASGRGLVSKL